MTKLSRALLAPYDKAGIADFARALHDRGTALLATSGTARVLREAGLLRGQQQDSSGDGNVDSEIDFEGGRQAIQRRDTNADGSFDVGPLAPP